MRGQLVGSTQSGVDRDRGCRMGRRKGSRDSGGLFGANGGEGRMKQKISKKVVGGERGPEGDAGVDSGARERKREGRVWERFGKCVIQ